VNSTAEIGFTRWVIGPHGQARFDRMRRNLESIDLRRAQMQWHNATAFEPWMSSIKCSDRVFAKGWGPESVVAQRTALTEPVLVTEKEDIKRLRSVLQGRDGCHSPLQIPTYSSESVVNFHRVVPRAVDILKTWSPSFCQKFLSACQWIGPLNMHAKPPSPQGRGLSSHSFRHCILMEPPETNEFEAEIVALNLAHEVAHQVLQVYQASDSLIEEASMRIPVFSVIRKVDRPAIMSFHAIIASVFMAEWTHEALGSIKPSWSQRAWLQTKLRENIDSALVGFCSLKDIPLTQLGLEMRLECLAFMKSIGG
jgi:hypothetical protein